MKALLALMFITPLAWTKVVIPISTTNIGLPVNLDKDENLGALDVMKIMEEATKFTKEPKAQGECGNEKVDSLTTLQLRKTNWVHEQKSCSQKRQLAALLASILSFLVKNIAPLFSNLLSAGKPHVAAKFTKNLIPHTAIANTDAHDSIRYHIDNEEGHQIMNVIKAHTRDWDVKEAYPQLEHPSDRDCRRNIPIFDKIFTKRLSSSTLGSNTFIQTLLSHMSETIQEKIHLAAIKLDNLIASADEMVTNTSINAFFDDIKKTIKAQGILEIEKISSNILQTVTDILASIDSYKKIAIFCILG